jgi:hypothetical protein
VFGAQLKEAALAAASSLLLRVGTATISLNYGSYGYAYTPGVWVVSW